MVSDGLRPKLPDVNPILSEILSSCWIDDPQNRPTFEILLTKFQSLEQ